MDREVRMLLKGMGPQDVSLHGVQGRSDYPAPERSTGSRIDTA